ncbi:hypothetical protein QAD02_005683 [Eretmocerus hayati]|uniref:Uncharacterized protein n=1 Tax=Eretmocerus hayati TaxID=131215 RepID=A0ACC2NTF0_9HYME|nr:hypothetical protein QAD02_005683 [Eretmocerus hayati]
MARYNVIVGAVLVIAIGGVQQVDGVILNAIGVISGVAGIIDFVKNKFDSLSSDDRKSKEETQWKSQVSDDIHKILEVVESLKDDIVFSTSMDDLRNSFNKIRNNYETIVKARDDLAKKKLLSESQKDRYDRIADEIIRQTISNSPLKTIYDTIGDSSNRYSSLSTSFLKQYQVRGNITEENLRLGSH